MAMKMKTTTVVDDGGILKFNDYKAVPCTIKSSEVTSDSNGRKIVKAGTEIKNGESVIGLLFKTVDVTDGDVAGAAIYEGSIDNKKLAKLGVTVTAETKSALPRVTFFD